jgi:GTP-binding protein HflX
VREVLQELGAGETPVLHVLNKVDRVEDPQAMQAALAAHEPAVLVSAAQGLRLEHLLERIAALRAARERRARILLPWRLHGLGAALRSALRVLEEEATAEGTRYLVASSADSLAELLRPFEKKGCVVEEKW